MNKMSGEELYNTLTKLAGFTGIGIPSDKNVEPFYLTKAEAADLFSYCAKQHCYMLLLELLENNYSTFRCYPIKIIEKIPLDKLLEQRPCLIERYYERADRLV